MKILNYLFFGMLLIVSACKSLQSSSSNDKPKLDSSITSSTGLIKDCPDERIHNAMPITDSKQPSRKDYYIYKGQRKEIEDFDSLWIIKNCKVLFKVVY